MKFATWDLECTSLKADQGFLLCCGIKPLGEKPYILGLDQFKQRKDRIRIDDKLALAIRDELHKYDGWITWNGLMFDTKFLNDRLMISGHKPLEPRFHIDAMWQARKGRLTSSRLDWVSKWLGVADRKTPLDMNLWKCAEVEALAEFKKGKKHYKEIVVHCKQDLKVTEQVFYKVKDRIRGMQRR